VGLLKGKSSTLHAQPTHEFVTTDQIGALSVFVCSNAATSMTGTALPIEADERPNESGLHDFVEPGRVRALELIVIRRPK
jgi:hypothetical protein